MRSPCRSLHRIIAILCSASAAVTLAGCGASQTNLVRAKVMQFATASHAHDYTTICRQVLAPVLLADIASGGISCEKAMSLALGTVRDARLTVGTIKVSGSTASVLTSTQATGEKTAVAILELTKMPDGWRIESLGNAGAGV
jgi:hypothetical protein